jgi:hypothetical protein
MNERSFIVKFSCTYFFFASGPLQTAGKKIPLRCQFREGKRLPIILLGLSVTIPSELSGAV